MARLSRDATAARNALEANYRDASQRANDPATPKPATSRQDSSRAPHIGIVATSVRRVEKTVSADPESLPHAETEEQLENIESDAA
ncbi:hypothetical protein FGB62_232g00 [Gracilaria domingensis]|nr:hypothetical protein FGB62_232g00 [Gracilaria domingensis]